MRLETRKLADLIPAEYNPRKQLMPGDPEYESLAESIETNGYIEPIVINEDGTIIGGHQRRTVMMDLGIEEAQVCVVNIPDKDREKAANLALNKITGQWDEEKLRAALEELDETDIGLEPTGFSEDELQQLRLKFDEQDEDDLLTDDEPETFEQAGTQKMCTCPKCGFTFTPED
ncbi:MAG: ParB N-terminal domain-containing protein [Clostridia bacterium]|nr:ParB N-terminal domain-containing protein [Clostridia bacterium]